MESCATAEASAGAASEPKRVRIRKPRAKPETKPETIADPPPLPAVDAPFFAALGGNPSEPSKRRSTRQAFKSSYCVIGGISGRLGETTTMQQAHHNNLTYRLHQQRLQMAPSIELRMRFLTMAFHAQLRSEKELIASRIGRLQPGVRRAFLEARLHQLN